MADRNRFRIMDLVVAVAASALAFAGYTFMTGYRGARSDVAEVVFWLVLAGYLLVGYLVWRFVRSRSLGLMVMGVALAFGAAADGMYLGIYSDLDVELFFPVGGLMAVAFLLVFAGIVHGLLDHWHELRRPRPAELPEVHPPSERDPLT